MTDYSERYEINGGGGGGAEYDDYAMGSPQDEKPPGYEEPAADSRSQVCSPSISILLQFELSSDFLLIGLFASLYPHGRILRTLLFHFLADLVYKSIGCI